MLAHGLLEVTTLQIHECTEREGGDHFRIFYEDEKGSKWWWMTDSKHFIESEHGSALLVGSRHMVETILKTLNLAVQLKKGEHNSIIKVAEDFGSQMDDVLDKLLKDKLIPPIRVTRGHMGDLEAASLNCGSKRLRAQFEALKKDPGFEIVDNPEPGGFYQDLSILFMYPNEIEPLNVPATDTRCKACQIQVKNWKGDDPKCGFVTGHFTEDNWNCATISKIRYIADRLGREDIQGIHMVITDTEQRYSTIATNAIPLFRDSTIDTPLCLWVGWYKNRGCTEAMWLMFETEPPRQPTEEECLAIIEAYSRYFPQEGN